MIGRSPRSVPHPFTTIVLALMGARRADVEGLVDHGVAPPPGRGCPLAGVDPFPSRPGSARACGCRKLGRGGLLDLRMWRRGLDRALQRDLRWLTTLTPAPSR